MIVLPHATQDYSAPSAAGFSGANSQASLPAMISLRAMSLSEVRGVASTSGRWPLDGTRPLSTPFHLQRHARKTGSIFKSDWHPVHIPVGIDTEHSARGVLSPVRLELCLSNFPNGILSFFWGDAS